LSPGPLKLYSYSRCSTCRKAIAWLDQKAIAYSLVDITLTPPSRAELALAWERLPVPRRLFNTSGLSYRALGPAVVKEMEPEQAIDALSADGKLIRRPFLISSDGSSLLVGFGFDPLAWSQVLVKLLPEPSADPALESGH